MKYTRACLANNGCGAGTTVRHFKCNIRCGNVHPCLLWPNPCENGGTCTFTGDSHGCMCAVGWTGHHCEVRGSTYLGCFVDDKNDRDLPELLLNDHDGTTNDVDSCIALCKNDGYAFAGLQYGKECWCGNSYGKHGIEADVDACAMKCSGNEDELCGGPNRNRVYQIV